MANNKTLDVLIREVINEDFNADTWGKIMPKKVSGADISKGGASGLPDVDPNDLFNNLKTSGTNKTKLDATDIEYYIKNPKEINTKVQSQLIAISRMGERGDGAKFDAKYPKEYVQWMEKSIKDNVNYWKKEDPETGSVDDKWPDVVKDGEPFNPADINRDAKSKGHRLSNSKTKFQARIDIIEPRVTNRDNLVTMAKKAEEALSNLDKLVASAAKEKQSVSSPSFKPVTAEAGGFPPEQLSVVKRVLGSGGDFKAKLEKVSAISKVFYDADAAALKAMAPSELLSNIQFLDIMNSFVKEFDSGSGAYLFEYFLALMAGGAVTGKDKTAAGKMGAVDFMIGDKYGSAKYLKSFNGATQAKGGFEDIYNKTKQPVEMLYVIALKKQDQEQRFDPSKDTDVQKKGARGTSDPTRIIGLEIYTPTVKFDGTSYTVEGQPATFSKGKINVGANPGSPIGFIYLTKSRTSTFRQMLGEAIDTQEAKVKSAFEQFKKYFQSLEDASSKAKIYINDGKQDDGNAVYKSLNNAESEFDQISGFLEHSEKPVKPVAEAKENQKKSLKDLDKLIERVIIEHMHK